MTDLEKAQEVLRRWHGEAYANPRVSLNAVYDFHDGKWTEIWACHLFWVEHFETEDRHAGHSCSNPLTAALEATRQTPWPQSVPEGSE